MIFFSKYKNYGVFFGTSRWLPTVVIVKSVLTTNIILFSTSKYLEEFYAILKLSCYKKAITYFGGQTG